MSKGRTLAMDCVHATLVQDDCPECRNALLEEGKSLGLPLQGDVVIIPKYWLSRICPHGRAGLKFAAADTATMSGESERAKSGQIELEARDSRIDATKNFGFPAREHGPYGSSPMQDPFDDESGPDGSGKY